MSLKDLLVYVDQSECASARLHLAADLARRHKSRLTALYDQEWTARQRARQNTGEFGLASAEWIDRLQREVGRSIDAAAERLRAELRALAREHHLETDWRHLHGPASAIMPQLARVADLCILSHDVTANTVLTAATFPEQVLFGAGRPVVFVPAFGALETLGRHIVVAWNSSRPAARALNVWWYWRTRCPISAACAGSFTAVDLKDSLVLTGHRVWASEMKPRLHEQASAARQTRREPCCAARDTARRLWRLKSTAQRTFSRELPNRWHYTSHAADSIAQRLYLEAPCGHGWQS